MPYLHSIKLERQTFAFTKITVLKHNLTLAAHYKTRVESLGMIVYNNGLVSALSLLKNSQKEEDRLIYTLVAEWIHKKKVIGFAFDLPDDDLLKNVLAIIDSRILLALSLEILSLTDVMKEILKAEV